MSRCTLDAIHFATALESAAVFPDLHVGSVENVDFAGEFCLEVASRLSLYEGSIGPRGFADEIIEHLTTGAAS